MARGKKRKPARRLQRMAKKHHLFFIYAMVIGLLLFTVISKNPLLLFLLVTLFCSIINYHTNMTTIRFNPDPEVFFSLLLTRSIGLEYGLVMLLVPTLFIDIYTARLDIDTLVSFILTIIINFMMSFFPLVNFAVLGVILVTFKFITGLIINLAIDISPQEIFFEHVLGFVSNMLMFLAFGNMLLNLVV